ncbi:MAG: nuclear transport factor 2 family protein [Magnetococcales bacterium]|nr:nuclear transport factor 2 family protein [Magnetococcales bacterium]
MKRVPSNRLITWLMLLGIVATASGCTSSFTLPWEDDILDASRVATVEPLELPPDMETLPEPGVRMKEVEAQAGAGSASTILFGSKSVHGEAPELGRNEQAQTPDWMRGDQVADPSALAALEPHTPESFQQVLSGQKSEIQTMVDEWADAWQTKDLPRYFGFYSQEFRTPRHMNREAWMAERTKRINEADKITVELSDMKVVFQDDGRAQAIFTQHYRSGRFADKIRKLLFLRPEGGSWKILTELSEKL